jgi:hypothetical protein
MTTITDTNHATPRVVDTASGEMYRLLRRLLTSDDGIGVSTRREVVRMIRSALERQKLVAERLTLASVAERRAHMRLAARFRDAADDLEDALDGIAVTSPRAAEWPERIAALRAAIAEIEPAHAALVERAGRRFGRMWIEHVEREVDAELPRAA